MNQLTKSGETPQKGTGNKDKKPNNDGKRTQGRYLTTFKGETAKMNDKVFQLLSEQPKRGQFEETMEALQRYANKTYPLDGVFLLPLFKDLSRPVLEEPTKARGKGLYKRRRSDYRRSNGIGLNFLKK